MNIDELSKSQLLLLTLLVNFVMSIATGIVTVSLLDQASPVIAQTVNRIVEHTVQTVVPAAVPTIVTTPTKAQPTEEDQLVAAVSGITARTVQIKATRAADAAVLQTGVYLAKSRIIATAANKNLPQETTVVFADGTTASVSLAQEDTNLAIFSIASDAKLPAAAAAALLAPANLKQGQAVIGLTSDGSAVTGIISKISADGTLTATLPATPVGSGAVNLAGDLVGVTIAPGSFATANDISNLLASSTSAKP
jgi:hypothetical protein